MTQQDSEKRLEQYWDGAITAIELALLFIANDLKQYTMNPWRRRFIKLGAWILSKADFLHR